MDAAFRNFGSMAGGELLMVPRLVTTRAPRLQRSTDPSCTHGINELLATIVPVPVRGISVALFPPVRPINQHEDVLPCGFVSRLPLENVLFDTN